MKEICITIDGENIQKQQGDLFGIFIEDLNHAADGGLYGELVRNRSFEFDSVDAREYHAMTAWSLVERGGSVAQAHVETAHPLNFRNPHYLVLEVMTAGEGGGICNEGYAPGIPVEKGQTYKFSCFCKRRSGKKVPLEVRLESQDGEKCYASAQFVPPSQEWGRAELSFEADGTDYGSRLVLVAKEAVCVELDMISLFPADTFAGRENGLRKDIAQMIKEMKPRFVRFPGGCLAHIGSLNAEDRNSMYRWKNTVGAIEERSSRRNTWNYNQTFGLGFYEYFVFCEDIGAQPLPVISAGYDPHFLRMAELDKMQEWIDEALDLIEFANGDAGTKWGAVRARMGHPESFRMKYLGIGNEEVGDAFFERYEIIQKAVKERYPEIEVINSAGPGSGGSEFVKGWEQARRTDTSFVDEHFYQNPEWFLANAHRYDTYQPTPKAFVGEYASHDDKWKNALAEAAFMTGMEKAQGVGLACYAPLLCNVNYANWKPVLLYYNNHQVYGSPSYYVQKLFMNYQGESLLAAADNITEKDKETPALSGEIAMGTGSACVDIYDIRFVDLRNGTVKELQDFNLSPEHVRHSCMETDSDQYELSFSFCKRNGNTAGNLNGKYGFQVEFAVRDEKNKLMWTIDGWQRLTSLKGMYQGSDCDMGLYFFETEKDRTYQARLLVEKNHVRTFIDGKEYCSHFCKSAEPDTLYYSAVKEQDGTVTVKAVNAERDAKLLHIELQGEGTWQEVEVLAMEGYKLDDCNSFEQAEQVVPVQGNGYLEENCYSYSLPAESMAVMRFKADTKSNRTGE